VKAEVAEWLRPLAITCGVSVQLIGGKSVTLAVADIVKFILFLNNVICMLPLQFIQLWYLSL
jgi:hypothetical protein